MSLDTIHEFLEIEDENNESAIRKQKALIQNNVQREMNRQYIL